MGVADNVNLVLQIIGRIHRLGQSRTQRVWIITLARSYHNFLQYHQSSKMVEQLAGEGDVKITELEDPIVASDEEDLQQLESMAKGKNIRLQCEEMIRQLLRQRVSRATDEWADKEDLEPPWRFIDVDDEYHPPEVPKDPADPPADLPADPPADPPAQPPAARPAAPPAAPASDDSPLSDLENESDYDPDLEGKATPKKRKAKASKKAKKKGSGKDSGKGGGKGGGKAGGGRGEAGC